MPFIASFELQIDEEGGTRRRNSTLTPISDDLLLTVCYHLCLSNYLPQKFIFSLLNSRNLWNKLRNLSSSAKQASETISAGLDGYGFHALVMTTDVCFIQKCEKQISDLG